MYLNLGGYNFTRVCTIAPQRTSAGLIQEFMPQSRYKNVHGVLLNRYGKGPFCKFRIPNTFMTSGAYAVLSGNEVTYIGECQNLTSRYNTGYGNISPRNCFIGGQETNRRLNNLILVEAQAEATLSLWFFPTEKHKIIERNLLKSEHPAWNLR